MSSRVQAPELFAATDSREPRLLNSGEGRSCNSLAAVANGEHHLQLVAARGRRCVLNRRVSLPAHIPQCRFEPQPACRDLPADAGSEAEGRWVRAVAIA